MRHRGPQADGRDVALVERVVQHADDSRRPLVTRALEAELLDELVVARAPRHGSGTRVRDIREQRAERDDKLDAEIRGEVDDQLAELPPAQTRLDAEQQHGVAVERSEEHTSELQ